ncbi:MAG: MBL fold metallo-hydrolase [Patescibacteria group bacterium]|nr:MBL fold metallo-hydrolase [Patescibacteria group bacterium]
MKLTIIYDNESQPGLKSDWGFSCLIENAKKILFDTGADSEILLYNMKQLKINSKDIDIVILSHNHWDHIGGLKGFLEANENRAKVYQPRDFSKPTKISQGIYSTGALGVFIKEQSLIVNTKKGNIVITGYAHPGLENIIDTAKQFTLLDNQHLTGLGKIYGIVGGFHGFSTLEKLKGIKLIAPCHCTQHKQEIKEKYPANYKKIKAGSVIEII